MLVSETRIALVTGANKGIGKEIARELALHGMTVYLGARDQARGESAAAELGPSVRFLRIDMHDPRSFREAAEYLEREHGRLDVLVNNAGVLDRSDRSDNPSEIPVQLVRDTFEANLFGAWDLTATLAPLLKKSASCRIVNQTSVLASLTEVGKPGMWLTPAYSMSKAAMNMMTVLLAREFGAQGRVNAAHPGYVRTDMTSPDAPLSPEQGAKTAVDLVLIPDDGPTGGFFHLGKPLSW